MGVSSVLNICVLIVVDETSLKDKIYSKKKIVNVNEIQRKVCQ